MLVDPLAQKYMRKQPVPKETPVQNACCGIHDVEVKWKAPTGHMKRTFLPRKSWKQRNHGKACPFLKVSPRVLILKEIGNGNRVLRFSMFHWAETSMLYSEF